MNNITPDERSTMPREVAIAMLSEPKARITNRMRKNCKDALSRVFTSATPLRKSGDGYVAEYPRTDAEVEQAAERKLASMPLAKLAQHARRTARNRSKLQGRAVKLESRLNAGKFTSPRAAAFAAKQMAVLEMTVRALDDYRDRLDEELGNRASAVADCDEKRAQHIDPAVRRHNALVASVALAQ